MKKRILVSWSIVGGILLFAGTEALSEEGTCATKCEAKNDKCTQAVQKGLDKCVAKADKWKASKEKAAQKAKDPKVAMEKVLTGYEKMKKACDAAQTKANDRCTKASEKCAKGCEKKEKTAKKPAK
ncbi:MAG: hypothetical protein V1754_06315 [Pseudomonadota bacterium]